MRQDFANAGRRRARNVLAAVLFGGGTCIACAASMAQNYPTKPVRFVVPFAPGGGTDVIGRLIAQQLNEELGQPVVVDNRAGAGSALGAELVAKSPADGYTVLFGNISLAFNQALYASLPFNAVADFAPVTLTSVQPNVVVIHPAIAAQTLMEFAALARAKPGQITFSSAGIGSGTHLAGELLAQALKITLLHVPYRGTGPALTDTVGGQVQMMVSTFAPALPLVRSGRLRALGVTSAKRSSATPEIPTLIEAGVPGFDYSTWYGILAPARTPRPIVNILHRKTIAALAHAETKRKLEAQGVETATGTPAEFLAYIKSETDKWAKVVRAAGIPPQ
jgi:tripartite-type tricarboxylate transporter receptor subunit TctC